jgi:hydroxymethylpyrimidine/phosphomethylpyrimidine kinase
MPEKPAIVLTIAGFDPSCGAGVTADIKTIAAHGCYGIACISALTVQSTTGVRRLEVVDPVLISETLVELASDFQIAAVHIGMLGSAKVVKAVAEFLTGKSAAGQSVQQTGEVGARNRLPNIVLDPILKSSSGTDLLDAAGTGLLIDRLIPVADVITPNVDEAEAITGIKINNLEDMKAAANRCHQIGAPAVVITGGHMDKAIDLLSFTSKHGIEQEIFKAERQRSNSTHGTGCAFAASVACHLALDRGLAEAALLAKTYVSAAISNGQTLGHGIGPVHHLYRMNQQRRTASSGAES